MECINVLHIDDDSEFLHAVNIFFSTFTNYKVISVDSGRQALREVTQEQFDVVILDMAMPDMNGLETMRNLHRIDPNLPIIIYTGVGTIENAVNSMHVGAFHYITKPFDPEDLEALVQKAAETCRLNRGLADRHEEIEPEFIVGYSPKVQKAMQITDKVAEIDDATVLIMGELGTGKSLLAEYIHAKSHRSAKPFLSIDCAALSETHLESELFGHVKGAFSGAVFTKTGILQKARGGTVFLDEVGGLSLEMQTKLLGAIQNKVVKPLGGNDEIPIDVRFLSATSRNLKQSLETGQFRKDLFLCLTFVQLHLPPLRQRIGDIGLFLDYFIRKFNRQYGKKITGIHPGAVHDLFSQSWPGNIRELENAIKRAVLLSTGDMLNTTDICSGQCDELEEEADTQQVLLKDIVSEAEKKAIANTLKYTGWNKSLTARQLGISRPTLYEKMALYSIEDPS